jgi:internalin A
VSTSKRLPLTAEDLRKAMQTGELDLSEQGLSELAPEIFQLGNLQVLRLDGNQLARLPSEIGTLSNLRALQVSRNQLAELPREIAMLSKLQGLWLDGNQLTSLPREIGMMRSLRVLRLDGNQLTRLPSEIGTLSNLRALQVSRNQLAELPPEIGSLSKLQGLWLDGNQLAELPREIGSLSKLQGLWLDGNQLTSLPRELADLFTGGLSIKLARNPLMDPLPGLIERGFDAVAAYLRSLEDAIPHYEARVLLLGEGNVGKTSLVASLCDASFVEDRPTTHGIEISLLRLRHPHCDVDITVRAWDFGGQEVYRVTHQFFLGPRALYVLVWNSRDGHEQNDVEGWLRRVRLRVGQEAQVIIVSTHCEERSADLDYSYLAHIFSPMLVGHYEVDNKTGRGVAELRTAIAEHVARLPQMGQLASPRWAATRDEVVARGKAEPQIDYHDFVKICYQHGVVGDEIPAIANFLHDIGQIIYYGDDEGLRDIVVLNPEWLTKAISCVLEDRVTRLGGGVLDHARLREIWRDGRDGLIYPDRYHPYFLRLMEKFDICYRLGEDDHRSLVAQLVPHEPPELPWHSRTPLPRDGTRRLSLICRFSETAPGLIAWLTVRHHGASTGLYWRRGLFLRHPVAGYASEALVELRSPVELAVEVRAPSPDLFFNVLRDSIESLIQRRWPGLSYQLSIPCPTRGVDGTICQGHFPLDGLLRYRERGGSSYACLECVTEHDVSQLLTGFAVTDTSLQLDVERLNDRLEHVSIGVGHIASGIERLECYAAETADSMRRILRIVSSEITDCPRLFTISLDQRGRRLLKPHFEAYRIVLWCEHLGHWHPWPSASYTFQRPRDWLIAIGPYATLLVNALKLVVPIAGSVAGVVLSEQHLKLAQHELELMRTLVGELPNKKIRGHGEPVIGETSGQLTVAEGQALRAVRMLLFERDHAHAFGGLRRVQAPSGDLVWVCPHHYVEYDPGLPTIDPQ